MVQVLAADGPAEVFTLLLLRRARGVEVGVVPGSDHHPVIVPRHAV